MTKAPERIWASALNWEGPERANNNCWIASTIIGNYCVANDDGWHASLHDGCEYWEWEPEEHPRSYRGPEAAQAACHAHFEGVIRGALRTDLSDGLIAAAYEAAAAEALKAMNGYCHPIGKGDRYALGVQAGAVRARDAIRALTPADARAALERVAQPRWYRMDDPENPPPEGLHTRGLWVFRAETKERLYFQADLGHIHDETGEFVGQHDEYFGWAAEDYTHWTPLLAPPEDEG